jgi:hypothetical protein
MDTALIPAGLRFLVEAASGRPIRPEDGEAPVRAAQVDPACMPRMCPGLARARLALYRVARPLDIVQATTDPQYDAIAAERQGRPYQNALAAYLTHLAICPACREMLQDNPEKQPCPTP